MELLVQLIQNSTIVYEDNKVHIKNSKQELELRPNGKVDVWPRIIHLYHFIAQQFHTYVENSYPDFDYDDVEFEDFEVGVN